MARGMQWNAVSQAAEESGKEGEGERKSRREERGRVEGKRTEEGVLPLVGHREDVGDVHVLPVL